jgi:hypothetical protein
VNVAAAVAVRKARRDVFCDFSIEGSMTGESV